MHVQHGVIVLEFDVLGVKSRDATNQLRVNKQ